MNKTKNYKQELFDNLIINTAKGIGMILAGIGGLCAVIVLYGLFYALFGEFNGK